MSNIHVQVGLIQGTAYRIDDGSADVEPNTKWTIPLHSCATALYASVADVTFLTNGTVELTNLQVSSVRPRSYQSQSDAPLWAVEKTGFKIQDIAPFWALVDNSYDAKDANLFTRRGTGLYLPAGYSLVNSFTDLDSTDATAGPLAPTTALGAVYANAAATVSSDTRVLDYSGATNYPFFIKWQQLSRDPDSSAAIINLVWTDIMANYVVGTLSNLNRRNGSSSPNIVVESFEHAVCYDLRYAVPAFVFLFLYALAMVLVMALCVLRRATLRDIRALLAQTATGRAAIIWKERAGTFSEIEQEDYEDSLRLHACMRTKEWTSKFGSEDIGLRKRPSGRDVVEERTRVEGNDHYLKGQARELKAKSPVRKENSMTQVTR
jgi:hypothetical protein